MKKIIFSLVAVAMSAGAIVAQSVDAGKKFFYYQRYKSAQDQLEKVLASNPNNIDGVYWLGQTLLQEKNQAGAKDLYQKALMTNGSAPLVLVGMGHIELLEGKASDARQRFETAISLTKAKDIEVLNAIGRANADQNAKQGDPVYAIEKLNLATQIKGFKSPETYIILGDAYRKQLDGGDAVQSYQKALSLDPKYAEAQFKIGRIYLTQNNKDYFLPAFENATQLDANYAPAYSELFYYWYYHSDVDKAANYFDKYIAVSDPSPKNEYDRISILYPRKKYAECISSSQAKINSEGANADPRYYKLIAYCYSDQGDSVNAKNWLEQYFAKQKQEDFLPMDYSFRAQTLAKFPGNEAEAFKSYEKAVQTDTLLANKLSLMAEAAALAKKMGNRAEQAKWLGNIYRLDPKSSKSDLYNYGFAYYQAAKYDSSLAIFTDYKTKYPDEIFGYLWAAKSEAAIDTSLEKGMAVADYQKLVEVAKRTDSVKYKAQIVGALFYLAQYSNDIKKDKEAAIEYIRQITYVDPANDQAKSILERLTQAAKAPARPPARQPAAKPKTGSR